MVSKIVNIINENFKKSFLKEDRFLRNNVVGIAQLLPVKENEKLMLLPSFINENGEAEYIGPDDEFDLIIYHRITNVLIGSNIQTKAYGDNVAITQNTYRVSLVVFGTREKLHLTNDELAILMQLNFIDTVDKNVLHELSLRACTVKINEIILNDLQVFNEEFEQVPFFLKPEQFLFKINYSIESSFDKICFNKCTN